MVVDVIIPCFNEKERIVNVVSVLKEVKSIKKIIIVDDGSTFETKKILDTFSDVQIVTHDRNMGKTLAIKSGLMQNDTNAVLFVDADIKGLRNMDVERMIQLSENVDMVLGIRDEGLVLSMLTGFSQAYTGERVVSRSTGG